MAYRTFPPPLSPFLKGCTYVLSGNCMFCPQSSPGHVGPLPHHLKANALLVSNDE